MKRLVGLLPLILLASCGQENFNSANTSVNTNQSSILSNKSELKSFTVTTYDINDYFLKPTSVKQNNLNSVLHNINSDIVALQGVTSPGQIKTFNEKYLKDLNYKFYSSQDLGSKNNSVILSKFNISKAVRSKTEVFPEKNLFKVNVTVRPDYSFTFYTVNFKSSKDKNYSQSIRDKEIQEYKSYIMTNQKSNFREKYLIVGNLNGSPTQPDLETIVDPRSSGLSYHDVITEDFGSGSDVYSYETSKEKSRPDYVLVSPNMFNEYVYNSVTIHNKDNKSILQSISDHYPVTAKFDLPQ